MSRHLHFPELHNARDLGGLPTHSGATTRWRAFVRTDGLHNLNDDGRAALHDYGVRTVIDLRMPEELSNLPNPLQRDPRVNFVHVSLLGAPGDESWRLNKIIVGPHREWALMMLDHAKPRFADVFRAIASAPPGAVLFHCHAGKDRTGLIADMLLSLAGVPDQEIVDDYDLSNERLKPLMTTAASKLTDPAERERVLFGWSVFRPTAEAVLARLRDGFGGVPGYLSHIGLTDADIDAVRQRLLDV